MKTILIAAVSLLFLFVIVFVSTNQLQQVKLDLIKPGDVQGMGVLVKGKEYTLNFSQQNALIEAVNEMAPAEEKRGEPLFFEKVIIYRFNEPVWTLSGNSKVITLHSKNKDVTLSLDDKGLIQILREASSG